MNMLEIGYQLRQYAGYSVGSEQTEPGEGWPYDTVLADLDTPEDYVAEAGRSSLETGLPATRA